MKDKIKVKLNYKLYDMFNKFHAIKVSKMNLSTILFLSLALVFLVYMIIDFNSRWLFFFIFSLVFPFMLRFMVNSQGKKIYNTSKDLLEEETTYTFNDDNLEVKSDSSYSKVGYEKIFFVRETNDAFYVYLSKIQAFIIPKECMKEKVAKELSKLLIEKMPIKKYKFYN